MGTGGIQHLKEFKQQDTRIALILDILGNQIWVVMLSLFYSFDVGFIIPRF